MKTQSRPLSPTDQLRDELIKLREDMTARLDTIEGRLADLDDRVTQTNVRLNKVGRI